MSAVRAPRWCVMLGGQPVIPVSMAVTTNPMFLADEFHVVLTASNNPLAQAWPQWAAYTSMQAEVRAGFPADPQNWTPDELTPLIYGDVDQVEIDPVADTITLSGRDLTRRFIDQKTPQKWQNLTPSQIAAQLAQQNGLKAQITPTPGNAKAGHFYSLDHVHLTTDQTEWDLLTYLAQQLGWVCYVQMDTLVFGPGAQAGGNDYIVQAPQPGQSAQTTVVGLQLARNLTVAKGIVVQVRSWNAKQAKGFTVQAKAQPSVSTALAGKRPGMSQNIGGSAQVFAYTIPGLTVAEAQARANALLTEISKQELRVQIQMAGDIYPSKGQIVRIKGTGSVFDQPFYPFEVTRTMDTNNGFAMTILAKNHSPQSTVLA